MSKMTTASDFPIPSSHKELKLVEFLELIGRGAELKFAGSEMEGYSLAAKIEFFLDDLFALHGLQRVSVYGA